MQKIRKFVFILFFLLAFTGCKQEQAVPQETAKNQEIERPDQGNSKNDTAIQNEVVSQIEVVSCLWLANVSVLR